MDHDSRECEICKRVDKRKVICVTCQVPIPFDINYTLVELPCGCQGVYYEDGRVCYEHDHLSCPGDIHHAERSS